MPVRLGVPHGISGLSGVVENPIYATGVGLVLFGADKRSGKGYAHAAADVEGVKGMWAKMKSWFQGNF